MFNNAYLPISLKRSQPLFKMAPPRSPEFSFLCLSHDKAQEIPPFLKTASPLSRNLDSCLDSCAYLMIRLRRSHYPCLVITPPRSTDFGFMCLSHGTAPKVPVSEQPNSNRNIPFLSKRVFLRFLFTTEVSSF